MTKKGAEQLQEELNNLKTVKRPNVIAAIAEAKAHGDLKENAEYHAARESQGFIEGRIQELEGKLSSSQIIDVTTIENNGRVIFGATVTLININTDDSETYTIVGEDEADLKQNKISISSPVAKSLIGKFEGDSVDVRTPSGIISYEVDSVEYI